MFQQPFILETDAFGSRKRCCLKSR